MKNNYHTASPILLITFNRPDLTKNALHNISKVKPSKLYIANDGPRENNKDDLISVLSVRKIIKEDVNWSCRVQYLISDKNQGCKNGVINAINWFFESEVEGIILEDDIQADTDFFEFCDHMLNFYRLNNKICLISGSNFQKLHFKNNQKNDYYFSRYSHVWGWASWRRSWLSYGEHLKSWSSYKSLYVLIKTFGIDILSILFWYKVLKNAHNNKIDTWDYQLSYMGFSNSQLTIIPRYNLTKNIGFDERATHTFNKDSIMNNMIIEEIDNQSINHPTNINRNYKADKFIEKSIYEISIKKVINKLFKKVKR
jgi:hypothetical protein